MIRITGMNSGLDTESIISELVSAQSYKKQKIVKDQTKLSWKQTAWKTLNSKIFSFHQKTLSNMRFSDAYKKKATKVSNPSAVSVVSGTNAVDGVQTLKVDRLATAGYLTGEELKDASGKKAAYTADTKLSEVLGTGIGSNDSLSFSVKVDGNTKEISLSGSSTISEAVKQLKEAGINASFDEGNQRFFLSSTKTGEAADFSFENVDANAAKVLKGLGITSDGAKRIKGEDAKITLNNAEFTSSSNTFSVNGLTITANEVTDKAVTLTTATDYDGIYDQIKSFLKSYNDIINEISTMYGADSADKYQPLTSEEKKAMSDDEVEEWEKKIKDSLLRKDESLGSIQDVMSTYMQKGIEIGGKTYYLSEFGINTGSYFDTTYKDRYALHIDGNADDEYSAQKEDKLKTAIAKDPELVSEFFQKLTNSLYGKMQELMSKTSLSSAMTFYNDVELKDQYESYTDKITAQEKKIQEMEDKWYSKFSKMETALAKLSSKTSAISGMLGM